MQKWTVADWADMNDPVVDAFRANQGRVPRTRLFDAQAELMPFFDGYRRRVKARVIPVVVFERLPDARDGRDVPDGRDAG